MRPALLLLTLLFTSACWEEQLALFTPSDGGSDAGMPFGVEAVAASSGHTCAIHDGALFCWGANNYGQLGLGDTQPRSRPTPLGAGTGWAQVALGYDSTCARKSDGTVWCWGDNSLGQLGQGPGPARNTPGQVNLGFAATALALHFATACVLGPGGALWCWGMNQEGQLGQNDGFPGVNADTPLQVSPGAQWDRVSTGQGHVCARRTDGTLWCWGRNAPPQLGQGAGAPDQIRAPVQVGTATDWLDVRATQSSSCALKSDHSLWCWGDAYEAVQRSILVPERVGTDSDWTAVEIETFVVCGLKGAGVQQCWGRDDEGQLGNGDTTSVYTPVTLGGGPWRALATGRFHRCALDVGGALSCTGANESGQLGLGDTDRRNVLTEVRF